MNELTQIATLFQHTQDVLHQQATRAINTSLVVRNWLFGWYLVEFEQHGKERASYGSGFLKQLAASLRSSKIKWMRTKK